MSDVASVRVLYLSPEYDLWGIPYALRPGQSPRDLYDNPNRGWIWLGRPGWFGSMSPEKKGAVRGFLDAHANEIPERPGEWTVLQ